MRLSLAALGLLAALPALAETTPADATLADKTPADATLVERGAYLARAADCMACHTTPEGGKPYAGGYAISSPLGQIYATNITPSTQYGIGAWSEAEFARALRQGVTPDGTYLYPAMPYDAYAGITDDDVAALYAFFMQGVAPVDEPPAQVTALPFPFSQRWSMAGWNLLFANTAPFTPRPGEDAELARGRYLVDALGHCASCHSPRNALMASDAGAYLAGAPVGGWVAPNITSDPVAGIGAWSREELVTFLRDGHVPGKAVAAGGMGEAVEHSLSHLTEADLGAMAAWLKSVPAVAEPGLRQPAHAQGTPPADTSYGFASPAARVTLAAAEAGMGQITADEPRRSSFASVDDGAVLYDAACAACHQPAGTGLAQGFYPSLYHSGATGAAGPENLVMTILDGVHRTGADGAAAMPAFRSDFTDAQVAAVAGYVAKVWGNPAMAVSPAKVAELRAGGPVPLLARLGAWLVWGPVIALVLLGLVVSMALGLRRSRRLA